MSKLFKNLTYEIGVYDFTQPVVENTAPIKTMYTSLSTLFSRGSSKYSYMLKLSNEMKSPIMDHVLPLTKEFENVEKVLVRIQTNPWRYSTHFDTYDQSIIMLDGFKRWIFFRKEFDSIEEEKNFIQHVNGLHFENLKNFLKSKQIPYHLKISKPGDRFFIPGGMYHAIENVNQGQGTIFLNVIHRGEDENLNKRFSYNMAHRHQQMCRGCLLLITPYVQLLIMMYFL